MSCLTLQTVAVGPGHSHRWTLGIRLGCWRGNSGPWLGGWIWCDSLDQWCKERRICHKQSASSSHQSWVITTAQQFKTQSFIIKHVNCWAFCCVVRLLAGIQRQKVETFGSVGGFGYVGNGGREGGRHSGFALDNQKFRLSCRCWGDVSKLCMIALYPQWIVERTSDDGSPRYLTQKKAREHHLEKQNV